MFKTCHQSTSICEVPKKNLPPSIGQNRNMCSTKGCCPQLATPIVTLMNLLMQRLRRLASKQAALPGRNAGGCKCCTPPAAVDALSVKSLLVREQKRDHQLMARHAPSWTLLLWALA